MSEVHNNTRHVLHTYKNAHSSSRISVIFLHNKVIHGFRESNNSFSNDANPNPTYTPATINKVRFSTARKQYNRTHNYNMCKKRTKEKCSSVRVSGSGVPTCCAVSVPTAAATLFSGTTSAGQVWSHGIAID